MPIAPVEFISDEIGNAEDTVELTLAGGKVLYAQGWQVEERVLQQPSSWSITIGFERPALELYAATPPRTPFELRINGALQASGRTDRRRMKMTGSGSVLEIGGRDALAPLHDGFVRSVLSFEDKTYTELVQFALNEVGLGSAKLLASNAANRKIKAGVPITEVAPPAVVNLIAQQPVGHTVGAVAQTITAKCGERWLEFLRRHLDRAGLCLWAAADGSFVLSTPNGQQRPTYSLYRQIALDDLATNILGWDIGEDATDRHTEAIIYGRGGGKKKGRVKARGEFIDQEMIDWGYDQAIVFRDSYTQSASQAAYYARRKLAEERRDGAIFEYSVAGHTLPLYGSTTQRAVITPDTTIEIADQLTGVCGVFYIETVRRERAPQTMTTMRLMRPVDMVFGEPSPETTGQTKPKPKDVPGGPPVPLFNYFEEGRPPPVAAVGNNAQGQYTDAQGNVLLP